MRVDGERRDTFRCRDVADVRAEGALVDRQVVAERQQDRRNDAMRQIAGVSGHGPSSGAGRASLQYTTKAAPCQPLPYARPLQTAPAPGQRKARGLMQVSSFCPVGTLPQAMRRDFSGVTYDEAMRRAREIVP